MPDWPAAAPLTGSLIHTAHPRGGTTGGLVCSAHIASGATVWPAANRALYVPFEIYAPCAALQIGFNVAVQSGNLDVGIYDVAGNRIVSSGSTGVAAAGDQVVDIADTTLPAAAYFLAMSCDNTTASFLAITLVAPVLQSIGVQQQALGSVTLPNPATFANPAAGYIPFMFVSTGVATI